MIKYIERDDIKSYKNKALVKSIIDILQTFEYMVITEGVETYEQMKEVTNLVCNIIQGYHYSKPLFNRAFKKINK